MGLDVSMQCVSMLTQSKNISLSPVRQKHWLASTHTPTQTHILSLALSTAVCQCANMSNFMAASQVQNKNRSTFEEADRHICELLRNT